MAKQTLENDSDSDEEEQPRRRFDAQAGWERNRAEIKKHERLIALLTDRIDRQTRQFDMLLAALAGRGFLMPPPEPPKPAEESRPPTGPRTKRCPADIILAIHKAGRRLTLDQLVEALDEKYSRDTISKYAKQMRASGELENDGFGYSLPE